VKEKIKNYVFIHLGARAHYQFAEAVSDKIYCLYTDIWIPSNFITKLLSRLPFPVLKKLLQRNNKMIDDAIVVSFPFSLFFHELAWKVMGINGWEKIIRRNEWFQQKVNHHLHKNTREESMTMFTFAYTALEPLKFAKTKGWKTILYQMDPGIEEEKIVKKELALSSSIHSIWKPAPSEYWNKWMEELKITDKIIVNSLWSKTALLKVQAPEYKITIMPLGLKANAEAIGFTKYYPEKFSSERPLKVLFLGILTLRKGLRPLCEAIETLKDKPIEFTFVGTPETVIPENLKVKVVSSVSRAETSQYYKMADVFLFPTLSDGFGLTQLEALSWKLPVISSRSCGDVIEDNLNGIVLKEVNKDEICKAILYCCDHPNELKRFSDNTDQRLRLFSLERLENELLTIF
jgi:glycosyltransferase involved in cell wall biosynthesis